VETRDERRGKEVAMTELLNSNCGEKEGNKCNGDKVGKGETGILNKRETQE
jgi:hypothetical protein